MTRKTLRTKVRDSTRWPYPQVRSIIRRCGGLENFQEDARWIMVWVVVIMVFVLIGLAETIPLPPVNKD